MTDKELLELLRQTQNYKGASLRAYIRGLIKLLEAVEEDEHACDHNCEVCTCKKLVRRDNHGKNRS